MRELSIHLAISLTPKGADVVATDEGSGQQVRRSATYREGGACAAASAALKALETVMSNVHEECPSCRGDGQVSFLRARFDSRQMQYYPHEVARPCDECGGVGHVALGPWRVTADS